MKVKLVLLCWAMAAGAAIAEKVTSVLEEELQGFFIPEAILSETKLTDVVEALEASYRKYSREISGKKSLLKIRLKGGAEVTLTGRVPSQSLAATLYQVAGQTGMEVTFGEREVRLSPMAKIGKRSAFQLPVHPHFGGELAKRTATPNGLGGELSQLSMEYQASELQRAFLELSLFVEDESKGSFDPKSSRLALNATKHERQRVELFLKSMNQGPRQIRVTTKMVKGSVGFKVPTGKFDPSEVQQLLRNALKEEGFELQALPSVVMLPGKSASLEMSRENVMFDDDLWLGQKLDLSMDLRGEGILGEFEFRKLEQGADEKVGRLAEKVSLMDSETLVREMQTAKGAEFFLMTVEVIDATGRRVR